MVKVKEIYDYLLGEFRPDDYSGEKGKAPYKKATTLFDAAGRRLLFVGGMHVGTGDPFIGFLKGTFEKFKPDFLLVERPCTDSEENLSWFTRNEPKEAWREAEWALYFAKECRIGFGGMDAPFNEFFNPFASIGVDSFKFSVFYWFLLQYYSFKSRARLNAEDVYQLAKSQVIIDFTMQSGRFYTLNKEFMEMCREGKSSTVDDILDAIIAEMTNKYIAKGPVLPLIDKRNMTTPYPFMKGYEINKVSALWTAFRDKYMIEKSVNTLRYHRRVIAVAGIGHIWEIRSFLEKELRKTFGTCETHKWV